MTIRIYPSLMPGMPIETHEWEGTLAGWLAHKGIDYAAHEAQPIVVTVNGAELSVEQWPQRHISANDSVEIRLLPHGGVFKGLGSIIGKIFGTVFGWLLPRGRAGSDYRAPGQGERLEASQAKANAAKLGEVVPELAGRFRRFPDYLTPPRRRFANEREQWLEFHACVGPGRYAIDDDDVKVGNTTFSAMGEDAEYRFFEPGEDVSIVSSHEHWYTSDEVGGTSSGTPGLELSVEVGASEFTPADSYEFDDRTITIPPGGGEFPSGWGEGTFITITVPRTYAITRDNLGGTPMPVYANRFTGDFRHIMPIGMSDGVEVVGAGLSGSPCAIHSMSVNAETGQGWVRLKTPDIPPDPGNPGGTPGTPIDGIADGNYLMRFTRAGWDRFRVTAAQTQQITVRRLMPNGALDSDWLGFSEFTSTGATITYLSGEVYGEFTSLICATPGNETTTTFEVDFFFPSGLAYIRDNGKLDIRSVEVEIQYRDRRMGGAFESVRRTYTAATLDQIGYTERIVASSPIQPEVRIRRTSIREADTQVQDTVHWFGLKARLPTRTSYPRWTTMSVRFRSGGKLGAQSENQVNVVATRILPTLLPDGSWGPEQPTRDISAFCRYIATTIGYTDDDLNMGELRRLHQVWDSRGETFNFVFDQTTVKEAINTVLAAGMAEMTVDDGLIRPVREGPRTVFEHSYSAQNMTRPLSRQFRAPRPDDADGVEVEYIDGETWTKQTVRCLLPGDKGRKMEKMRIDGVPDGVTAWRIGMRRRRELRYQRWEHSFSTEMDALNSSYRSYVALIDDMPGYGRSAILEGIEPASGGALLRVSEPLEWEPGADHVVAYRAPDGTLVGPFDASPGVDDHSVVADLPEPWPVVTLKMEPPHVYFGTRERWSFPALIRDIRPQGTDSAAVTADNYDVRVYADDDNVPPA